jgi:hypothetical protein
LRKSKRREQMQQRTKSLQDVMMRRELVALSEEGQAAARSAITRAMRLIAGGGDIGEAMACVRTLPPLTQKIIGNRLVRVLKTSLSALV